MPIKQLTLLLALAGGLIASGAVHGLRLSEPVTVSETDETFGAKIDGAPATVTLGDLLANPDNYVDAAVAVTTRVGKVCQKKGCFFIAQDGNQSVRVSFKDYGFFVPTDISGKTVTLVGALTRRELSQQEAEHFNSDVGGTGSFEAGVVYEIVATAVRIPRS